MYYALAFPRVVQIPSCRAGREHRSIDIDMADRLHRTHSNAKYIYSTTQTARARVCILATPTAGPVDGQPGWLLLLTFALSVEEQRDDEPVFKSACNAHSIARQLPIKPKNLPEDQNQYHADKYPRLLHICSDASFTDNADAIARG